jgi:23S rRNA (guanine745-N1)-methyltransferase
MVAARVDFLAAGHYAFIAAALSALAPPTGLAVDVGAGTGWHLGAVLDAHPGLVGLALDSSKYALRRAARSHPRAAAVLCDAWSTLPLADSCASLLLNVFAPRNGEEFARVLRPDGRLLVVTPGPAHLTELVSTLSLLRVDPAKPDRVATSLGPGFAEDGSAVHERVLALSRAEVGTLAGMGPSAWHLDPARLAEAIAGLAEPVRVTAQVRVTGYRRSPQA